MRAKARHAMTGAVCVTPGGRQKRSYRSRAKAVRAATVGRHDGVKLYPYACRECGLWHLTKQEPRG